MELSTGAERTCQRAVREAEYFDVVAKLVDVRWKSEPLVATKATILASRNNSLCFHANNLEGGLACARAPGYN